MRQSKINLNTVAFVSAALILGPAVETTASGLQYGTVQPAIAPPSLTNGLPDPIATDKNGDDGFSGGSQGAVALAIYQAGNVALAQILTGTLPPPPAGLAAGVSAADYVVAQRNVANLQALARFSRRDVERLAAAQTPSEAQTLLTDAGINSVQAAQIGRTVFMLRAIATTAGLPTDQTTAAIDAFVTILSGQPITAADLQRAIATYEAAVDNASLEFLQNPPAEFQVIQSALLSILNAGIRAAQTDSDSARDN
ncbi:MAG: hypothetical protein VKK04_08545 [Synechococcales bacterium]|nr:hypothetical protein [Synechococcales bacterium]